MNDEMMKKVMECKSAEEILALAKENGVEMTAEDAALLLESKKEALNELSDDELDTVSGGLTKEDWLMYDYTVVTSCHSCERYRRGAWKDEETGKLVFSNYGDRGLRKTWYLFSRDGQCGRCDHLMFLDLTGVCYLSRH